MSDITQNPTETIRESIGIETLVDSLFPAVSLDYANFSFANLANADFTNVTSAIGVNFNGAILTSAIFS